MTETTTINIEFKYLENLVLEYYKRELNDENIILKTVITSDGYTEYLHFVITKKVKIGAYEGETKYVISDSEIKNVLNKDLKASGYQIEYFNYEIMNNKVEKIKATIKQNQRQKQKRL